MIGDWDAAVRLAAPGPAVFLVRGDRRSPADDWTICAAMFFQGWSNALHLFSRFWWYDNLVQARVAAPRLRKSGEAEMTSIRHGE